MQNLGRMISVGVVAMAAGFVGGVWFVGSGFGFRFIPPPKVAPAGSRASPPPPTQRPRVVAVGLPKLPNLGAGSSGLGPKVERGDLLPSPGCKWVVDPVAFRLGSHWSFHNSERSLGGRSSIRPAGGGLEFLLIQSTVPGEQVLAIRPVFFDAGGNRVVPRAAGKSKGGVRALFAMDEYYLDPSAQLAADKVVYFGIEEVVPGAAKLAVIAAHKAAKAKQIAILPYPELGKPFSFDLPTADGKRVKSDDLRGKPVLVAVWRPQSIDGSRLLKKLVDAEKDDLAIVGVSFDGSVEDARTEFGKWGGKGSLVVVPNDPKVRRIWIDGVGLERMPAYFLIDREGILRFTPGLFDLEYRIDTVFGRPVRSPFGRFGPAIRPTGMPPKSGMPPRTGAPASSRKDSPLPPPGTLERLPTPTPSP